jgi:hypothetical protein
MSTNIIRFVKNNRVNAYQYRIDFLQPVNFKNQELALNNLILSYNWFNISDSLYNNAKFSYKWQGTIFDLTIPDGMYTVDTIQDYLEYVMEGHGHYLVDGDGNNVYYLNISANITLGVFTVTCTPLPLTTLPTDYTNPESVVLDGNCPLFIVLSNAFRTTIGFETGVFPAITQTTLYRSNSTSTPQISIVTSVDVHVDCVNTNFSNQFSQSIYTFSPTVGFNQQIIVNPYYPIFCPVISGNYNSITLSLRDQDGNPLLLNDPDLTCTLIYKTRQST